jgi:pimeloyl-ACP methyl ester carboxylesterase
LDPSDVRACQDFTLIAPDLFGHGESAKPLGDYSLGAHAGTLRDLMETLDVPSATIVGHSLGGGVAMQVAYLFPERCERLLLVSSGGLGREISLLLRAPTLPGSEWLLPLVSSRWLRERGEALGRQLRRLGIKSSPDIVEEWRGFSTLGDVEARRAFRTVVGPGGQTVDAHEKIYLFDDLPVLLVWGARDRLIPVKHAVVTRQAIPGSRLEVFEDAGHFPHLCDPERFARVLRGFIHSTSPRRYDPARWRAMLAGAPAHEETADVGDGRLRGIEPEHRDGLTAGGRRGPSGAAGPHPDPQASAAAGGVEPPLEPSRPAASWLGRGEQSTDAAGLAGQREPDRGLRAVEGDPGLGAAAPGALTESGQ